MGRFFFKRSHSSRVVGVGVVGVVAVAVVTNTQLYGL